MKSSIMATPIYDSAYNKSSTRLQSLQQWNNIRNELNLLECDIAVITSRQTLNDAFAFKTHLINPKIGEQVLLINNRYLISSAARTTYVGEFTNEYLRDHNFELIDSGHILNRFDPLNCLWESELKTLWVGINEDFSYEDFRQLASLFEGEDLIVRPLTMNKGYTRLALYLNSVNKHVLIHEHAFDEHAIYAISARYNALNNPLLYIPVSVDDVHLGAINSLVVGNKIIISSCSDDLHRTLQIKGIDIILSDVNQFTSMGTKCLAVQFE